MVKCVALIVAAGRGTRFSGLLSQQYQIPKQYREIGGKMVLRRCLTTFVAHPKIDAVRVVIHKDDRELYNLAALNLDILPPVIGGNSRQESVYLGLESLKDLNPDVVLIHDGARPLIDFGTINRVVSAVDENTGSIPGISVVESIKRVDEDGYIIQNIDRNNLVTAQTPQGFPYRKLLEAHEKLRNSEILYTDDSAIALECGIRVKVVSGNESNIKITSSSDLAKASSSFSTQSEIRTGYGFDAHRFEDGKNFVTLGGVEIPHSKGLLGHSDADVALHALTDAILGAISAGDIGLHFPCSDPKWKGASSDIFLRHAANILYERDGVINNVDLTIVCESPKITPHRYNIIKRISEILSISEDRISVKATTTEGMGYEGRKEGISSTAIVTVKLPQR